MVVTGKGQVTIPKPLRDAAGIAAGTKVEFALEGGRIVVTPVAGAIRDDRREAMRAAGKRAHDSMSPEFQQLSSDEIMEFLRGDGPLPQGRTRAKLPAPRAARKP